MNVAADITSPAASPDEFAAAMRRLCAWAAGLSAQAIPEPILRRAMLVLCDDIAAIVAARDETELRALQDRVLARSGPAEATVFRGGRPRVDRLSAAVANGAAADWCELDEGYRRATCHAGLYTIPALIAEAEATGASTRDMIRALVVGYEIAGRFARAFPFKKLVLHPHASFAAVGAAAGVAALRRLDVQTFVGALGSASTMVAPGPYNHAVQGALVRNVWPAAGAWCGMQAVEWAECGILGLPESPLFVFASAFGSEPRPAELVSGLGEEWAIADGYHKMHACCQYSHSAVEALLGILGELGRPLRPEDIRQITVETHRLGMTLDNRLPATTLASKFSIPHIMAVTAVFGHAGAEAFASTTLDNPKIARLRKHVVLRQFEPDLPWPTDRPARVTISLGDGSERRAECLSARGGPDRPFATEEIIGKIRTITAPVYPSMTSVMERLISCDPGLFDTTWSDVVTRMVSRA